MSKRIFDLCAAAIGLIVLLPLWAVVAILIKLDSKGPVLFKQTRVGRNFCPFIIYKFRTMVVQGELAGTGVTRKGDPRITRIGRMLRNLKIDELPQLFNVIKGDMSLVGSRPELPRYVQMFRDEYSEILKLRPGITDPASVKFFDEEEILDKYCGTEDAYVAKILPEKVRMAREYVMQSSLKSDLCILIQSMLRILGWKVTK
jgi:lipopolysaccharide/colanic/teichoic acid biosynthesis glycosyltransferase